MTGPADSGRSDNGRSDNGPSDNESEAAERQRMNADRLKERIYLTFVALAVVLSLAIGRESAWYALETVIVTTIGTLAAVFVADILVHLQVHQRRMTPVALRRAAMASFGAASAVVVPILALLVALFGWWSVPTALAVSAAGLVVSLGIIGYLAVRRIQMTWWQRLLAYGAEALVGIVVILLQILAHG